MKKFILFVLIVVSSSQIISAQSKGDKYIGGTLGVSTSTTSLGKGSASTTSTTVAFAPEFGYFIADKVRLSASVAYSFTSGEGSSINSLIVGPSIAYYAKIANGFYYTPQLLIGFGYTSSGNLSGAGFAAGLSFAGFEFRPNKHLGISFDLLSLSYANINYSDYDISSNSFSFQLGINPTVGFKYYF